MNSGAISTPPSPSPVRKPTASREMARTTHAWLVVGVIERDGGTLYCTALYVSPMDPSWASIAS